MNIEKRILLVDFANFEDYPIGGYLSFAVNLLEAFGPKLALVGITTSSEDPIGKWFTKKINGTDFDFFALARYDKSKTRHFVPDRLANFLLLKYYRRKIFSIKINNLFLQRQEMLIALADNSKNICFSFAGLENPLSISKYGYARPLASCFERSFFNRVKDANTILARGDDAAINDLVKRSKGKLSGRSLIKFPTRIPTDIFKPIDRSEARNRLGLSSNETIVLTTGRLAQFKGWKFMVDCYRLFVEKIPDSSFHLLGEGEDYEEIKAYLSHENLADKITLEGKKSQQEIALFLNAADLFIMGSYKEGWSTSLMEAIACGVPSCVTNFSSAREIIEEEENGFVISDHNKTHFVEGMLKALRLARPVRNNHVIRYSTHKLKEDLLNCWTLS